MLVVSVVLSMYSCIVKLQFCWFCNDPTALLKGFQCDSGQVSCWPFYCFLFRPPFVPSDPHLSHLIYVPKDLKTNAFTLIPDASLVTELTLLPTETSESSLVYYFFNIFSVLRTGSSSAASFCKAQSGQNDNPPNP